MTGSTVNSYLNMGVTIGVDGYTSPLTIEPVTFSGMPPNPPTITGGLIEANNPGGAGVYSDIAGASILNQGIVYGASGAPINTNPAGNGIDVFNGGTLNNAAGAGIGGGGANNGGANGVSLSSSTLFNSGGINGGYYGGAGVVATNSYILNTSQISGGRKGAATSAVGVVLTASTMNNQGEIAAGYPAGAAGAKLYTGSSLTNSGTGRIVGDRGGWAVYIASGLVLNEASARIQPSETAGQGVAILSGGTLNNLGSIGLPSNYLSVGTVGGTGVSLAAGAVLTNTGVIAGSGSSGTSAGGTGVVDTGDSFTNAGTIVGGAGYGVEPETTGFETVPGHGGIGVSLTGGSVTNTGSIGGGEGFGAGGNGAAGGEGVLVVTGSVTNNGTITGGGGGGGSTALAAAGIVLQAGSVVNNSIVAGGDINGNRAAGVDITGGSLTNAGTISGADGVDTGPAGGIFIDNAASIAGLNAYGVSLAGVATVTNSGQISGNTNAVTLSAGGSVTNAQTGTLTAGSAAVVATAAVTIVNLGSIGSGGGIAVSLGGGGMLTNGSSTDRTARIAGGTTGGGVGMIGGSLTNYGVFVAGYGSPVTSAAGASLSSVSGTNAGTITGGQGAAGHGAVDFGTGDPGYAGGFGVVLTNSTLTNTGTLQGGVGGEGGYGVYDSAVSGPGGTGGVGAALNGGSLGNSGTIAGGAGGEGGNAGINSNEIANSPDGLGGGGASVTAGTLHNTGLVIGGAIATELGGGYGVALSGGDLVNASGAMLAGGSGESGRATGTGLIESAGTANNAGTIIGGSGIYNVRGGTGVSLTGGSLVNTALLQGGAGVGGYYSTVGGTGLYLSGATATTSGTIAGGVEGVGLHPAFGAPGAAVVFGPRAATLIIDPGAVFTGAVIGSNSVTDTVALAQGGGAGTLEMGGSFSGMGDLQFDSGAAWTLRGAVAELATGQSINGFGAGDTIVLEGFAESGYSYVPGTGLELQGTGNPILGITGGFSTANFQVSTDGTNTTITVHCFAAGTRIATPEGEIAVESLREGGLVRLHDGRTAPVIWIGQRRIDCTSHPAPEQVWPVRVSANAFGPGLPRRDLLLSPDHAVFAAGVLIPVKCLINGTSIVQIAVPEARYFHVELPSHDVLLAEGLPVESYLDTGDRAKFSGGNVLELYPNFAARAWEMKGCAELVLHGVKLSAVCASLAANVPSGVPRTANG